MAIEIVDFPIKNGDFPWQNVSSPEGIMKHVIIWSETQPPGLCPHWPLAQLQLSGPAQAGHQLAATTVVPSGKRLHNYGKSMKITIFDR